MRKISLLVATVVGVAILLTLGFWQRSRLEWKTAKLAEIDAAAEAPPLQGMDAALRALERGEPLDFRRIAAAPDGPAGDAAFRWFRAGDGISWEVVRPYRFGRDTVLVAAETVPDGATIGPAPEGPFNGYLRTYEPAEVEGGSYSVDANRYYGFNPDRRWSDATGARPLLYLDAELANTDASALAVRKPELPNNHFQYMLTWWSFALMLVGFAVVLYRREDARAAGRKQGPGA